MSTGLYEYDIAEQQAADAAQARLQGGMRAPVFGAGGIQGSALSRRAALEESFARAIQEAERRRAMQEIARRTQEAEFAKRRRARAMQAGAGAIGNVMTGATAGIAAAGADAQKRQAAQAQPTTGASKPSVLTNNNFSLTGGFQWR